MEWLKKIDLNTMQFVKLIAIGGVALVGLYTISNLLLSGLSQVEMTSSDGVMSPRVSSAPSQVGYAKGGMDYEGTELSVRNVAGTMSPLPTPAYVPGIDAEAFEVEQYSATIETTDRVSDCKAIYDLKSKSEVIFENTNEYERGCSYTFKVEKSKVAEVLAIIDALDPKDLSESTYTIKNEVTDYTGEIEILEKKLASLDTTLNGALVSYENITALATRTGDVDSLARIIDSKLSLIERLTNTRLEVSSQLERIARSKSEALDRLVYTYFYVSVYENTFVDREAIMDSWKSAVQQFVFKVNTLIQELSIGFVALLLVVLKFTLYGIVILFALRFGYRFAKQVWKSSTNE